MKFPVACYRKVIDFDFPFQQLLKLERINKYKELAMT